MAEPRRDDSDNRRWICEEIQRDAEQGHKVAASVAALAKVVASLLPEPAPAEPPRWRATYGTGDDEVMVEGPAHLARPGTMVLNYVGERWARSDGVLVDPERGLLTLRLMEPSEDDTAASETPAYPGMALDRALAMNARARDAIRRALGQEQPEEYARSLRRDLHTLNRHRPYADTDTQRRQGLPTTGAFTPPTAVCHHDWGNGDGHCETWPCADATAVLTVHQIPLEVNA